METDVWECILNLKFKILTVFPLTVYGSLYMTCVFWITHPWNLHYLLIIKIMTGWLKTGHFFFYGTVVLAIGNAYPEMRLTDTCVNSINCKGQNISQLSVYVNACKWIEQSNQIWQMSLSNTNIPSRGECYFDEDYLNREFKMIKHCFSQRQHQSHFDSLAPGIHSIPSQIEEFCSK